jgi:hypothetical protein
MINPSDFISTLITAIQKTKALYDQKGKNDDQCKYLIDHLDSKVSTLETFQEMVRDVIWKELAEKQKSKWKTKSDRVENSLAAFNTWVRKRDGQCWIRKLVCSTGQSDDLNTLVKKFDDAFKEFEDFIILINRATQTYYLQQNAENTVINYSSVSDMDQ